MLQKMSQKIWDLTNRDPKFFPDEHMKSDMEIFILILVPCDFYQLHM